MLTDSDIRKTRIEAYRADCTPYGGRVLLRLLCARVGYAQKGQVEAVEAALESVQGYVLPEGWAAGIPMGPGEPPRDVRDRVEALALRPGLAAAICSD